MSITISNPSITHTFGNVACVAIDYIQSFFPENYFTKVHISTKMAHRQLDAFRANTGFWKNKKPMLVLRPRIEYDDSSKALYGSAMMTRVTHSSSLMEFGDLVPLTHDTDNGIGVHFLWNRYKIIYDIVIIVDTYNKQINIMNDLRNRLNIDWPYRIQTTLEAYIPKTVIYQITDKIGIDRNDTPAILDYMNTYSAVPITYKLHNGSGSNEFFMMYPTSIESFSTDLSPDDGESRGIISDTYTIGLSLSMEFNGVGVWYTFIGDGSDDLNRAPMDDDLIKHDGRIIPISSIPLDQKLGLEKGWKILSSPFYYVNGADENGVDTTSIRDVLALNSVQSLIQHHKKNNIPLEPFLQFRCFCDRQELSRGVTGFDIDIENQCIYTYHPDATKSYRLFVLINSLAIHNMASEIGNFNKET